MAPIIERVSSEGLVLGESPHWDADIQTLYYIDILGQTIHKYVPGTNSHVKASIGAHVSFIIPVQGRSNQFVIGSNHDLRLITWDGISDTISNSEKLVEVDTQAELKSNTFNDGKCDSTGRLWAGTLDAESFRGKSNPNTGSLYSIDKFKHIKSHVSGVVISNGLAWSPDSTRFYYVDSGEKIVYEFDCDLQNGELKNRKPLFTMEKHNIKGLLPDGQAIDTDGNLWIAILSGSCVIKIDTRKPETILQTVKLPATQITSVAFGGVNLDELYVTTGRIPTLEDSDSPGNGSLYRIRGLGVKGFPGVSFKLQGLP